MMITEERINERGKSSLLYSMFCVWTFFVLCRPQDYFTSLAILRPILTLGIPTLLLYIFSTKNGEKISRNKQFRLYRYLILALLISVPFSYYRSASLKDVFYYASITTMFFLLFYQLVDTASRLRSLLFAYCLGVSIYALFILKYGNVYEDRISFGNMFDSNDIVFFVISFITFNFLFLGKDNKKYQRILVFLNILLCLVVILKTGSRGGLIACVTMFAYLFIFKTVTIKIPFIIKIALVLLAIITLQLFTIDTDRYKTITEIETDYNVTGEQGRLAIWQSGLRMFLSHPLTGIGMNRFSEGLGRDRQERGVVARWQTAHNSLVQIGAETGILGLIVFCLMSLNVFRITGQIKRKSRSKELIKVSEMTRAGFIGLFICAMFLSQAYSIYWAFYIILTAVLQNMFDKESEAVEKIA